MSVTVIADCWYGQAVSDRTVGQILFQQLVADFHSGRGGDGALGAQRMNMFTPRGSLNSCLLVFLLPEPCYSFQSFWFLTWLTRVIGREGGDCQVDVTDFTPIIRVSVTWDWCHSGAGSYTMKLEGLSVAPHSSPRNPSPLSLSSEINFWTKRQKRHTHSIFFLQLHPNLNCHLACQAWVNNFTLLSFPSALILPRP